MAKVSEIAWTVGERPEKEAELVAAAKSETLPALQEKCRAMRAEGTAGVEGYEKVRQSRYLRHWTDAEGAVRLEARLCPDAGAKVLAALEPHHRRIFAHARREGRRESYDAYAADALVALAEGDDNGPRGMVHARVDHSALVRGFVEEGEVCDIPGIGPIPVSVARELLADGVLKVIVTKGVDVVAVAHGGRTVPAHVRSALETRDPKCVVPGCDVRTGSRSTTSCALPRAGRPRWRTWPGSATATTPSRPTRAGSSPAARRLDVGPAAGATTVSAGSDRHCQAPPRRHEGWSSPAGPGPGPGIHRRSHRRERRIGSSLPRAPETARGMGPRRPARGLDLGSTAGAGTVSPGSESSPPRRSETAPGMGPRAGLGAQP